jgi:AhpD family alkylhydroperoxidase
MSARINYAAVAPATTQAAVQLETTLKNSGLDPSLFELVKIRASQINGCAFCVHMHTTDARKHGETEMRIYLLNAWRESSLYSPRERAALAWTESLTEIADKGAPDGDYEALTRHFSETEIVNLTMLIGMINLWNRLAIGLRSQHPVKAGDQRKA